MLPASFFILLSEKVVFLALALTDITTQFTSIVAKKSPLVALLSRFLVISPDYYASML
jgi:hypothetical protein